MRRGRERAGPGWRRRRGQAGGRRGGEGQGSGFVPAAAACGGVGVGLHAWRHVLSCVSCVPSVPFVSCVSRVCGVWSRPRCPRAACPCARARVRGGVGCAHCRAPVPSVSPTVSPTTGHAWALSPRLLRPRVPGFWMGLLQGNRRTKALRPLTSPERRACCAAVLSFTPRWTTDVPLPFSFPLLFTSLIIMDVNSPANRPSWTTAALRMRSCWPAPR